MRIFVIVVFLITAIVLSSIDYKNFLDEDIKLNIYNVKLLNLAFNFTLMFIVEIYLNYIFKENYLYYINCLCFLVLYISSITDILIRNIYIYLILIFSIPIMILNYLGNYLEFAFYGLISAGLLYTFIYFLGKIIYKKESFGVGDIYILMLIGLCTDWYTVINIGLFTFVVCLSYYIAKSLVKMDLNHLKNYEIPLVPFIMISYLIVIYF